jgi:hypothetical protein
MTPRNRSLFLERGHVLRDKQSEKRASIRMRKCYRVRDGRRA